MTGHLQLPFNSEAELSVLSAIIQDNDSIVLASEHIQPADFYSPVHRAVYEAMQHVYRVNSPIDVVTLPEELRHREELAQVGGLSFIAGLYNVVPNSANIKQHCKIIKNKSKLRSLITEQSNIVQAAHEPEADIDGLIAKSNANLLSLTRDLPRQSPSTTEIRRAIYHERDKVQDAVVKYRFPASQMLQPLIPYFVKGDDWIIVGDSSVGKSTFLSQLVVDAVRADARVLLITLEDRRKEKLNRIYANIAGVSYREMRANTLPMEQWEKVFAAENEVEKWGDRLLIYDDVKTLDDTYLTAKKHIMQGGVDLIAIDYVQLMRIPGKGVYDKMSRAADDLFNMAKELDVCMIKLSQMSNDFSKDKDPERMSAKGAGELTAQPDVVIELNRQRMDQTKWHILNLVLKKSRQDGMTGKKELHFSKEWSRIVDPKNPMNLGA